MIGKGTADKPAVPFFQTALQRPVHKVREEDEQNFSDVCDERGRCQVKPQCPFSLDLFSEIPLKSIHKPIWVIHALNRSIHKSGEKLWIQLQNFARPMGNAFQHQEVESREEHLLGKKQQYLAGFKTSAKAQLPIPFTVPDDEKTDLMHVISPYSVTHLFKTGRLHLDSNCEVLLDLECSSPDFITTRVSLVKTTGEGREILEFSGNTCCLSLGKAFDIISRNIKVHAVMDKEDPVPASEVRLRIKLHCNSSVTEHTFTHNVEQPGEVVAFTFVAGF